MFDEYRIKREIKSKFNRLMNTVNNIQPTDKNKEFKIFKCFEIGEIFIKEYGFDCIILIPFGKSLAEFRKLLPSLSTIYESEIIAELSKNKNSIYARFHLHDLKISEKDNIRFKWYSMFSDSKERNDYGETFKLDKSSIIYHPTKLDKDGKKLLIGYRFDISIPGGLSYDTLSARLVDLNKIFGVCNLKFDYDTNSTTIEIINNKVGDKERYEPIQVKPWELYVGMTHSYKPIILNFKTSPNVLIGGASGSGKTVSMMMSLVNLLRSNSQYKVNLFICMLSDKQDLKAFKNTSQTKYYAKDIDSALAELRYLSKEVSRRNKLFDQYDENGSVTNIYEYNKVANSKLPLIYFCIDEVASFALNGTELDKTEEIKKKECSALMWKLAREGRSSGVYSILATQRGSLANMSGEVKGNLGNQLCFYFPNVASSLTILGDGDLASLAIRQKKQREFIAVADEIYNGKTLYLDMNMIIDLLKPLIEKDKKFLNINKNGDISSKNSENNEKTKENEQKDDKNIKKQALTKTVWDKDVNKYIKIEKEVATDRDTKPKSKWQKYQERRNSNG